MVEDFFYLSLEVLGIVSVETQLCPQKSNAFFLEFPLLIVFLQSFPCRFCGLNVSEVASYFITCSIIQGHS